MRQKFLLFIFCFLIGLLSADAQFEGLNSFSSDTLLMAKLKSNRVRSVTETVIQKSPTNVGTICFDSLARTIEIFMPNLRTKREYDEKNNLIKHITYNSNDTSKIAYWFKSSFDAKGRVKSTEYGQFQDEKLTISRMTDSKIIKEEKDVTRIETYRYMNDIVVSTIQSLDSISGIYKFEINTISEDLGAAFGIPAQSAQVTKKEITRKYTIDNCSFEDKIEYQYYGGAAPFTSLETKYHQRNENGLLIEFGLIDYTEAYEKYLAEHPNGKNGMDPLSGVAQTFLVSDIKGQKAAYTKYTYNAEGLLTEKTDKGNKYKFKYNGKGQIIELICEGHHSYTEHYWYNEKGLLIKVTETPGKQEQGEPIAPKDRIYFYTFY